MILRLLLIIVSLLPVAIYAQQTVETTIPLSQVRDTSVVDLIPVSSGGTVGVTWKSPTLFQDGVGLTGTLTDNIIPVADVNGNLEDGMLEVGANYTSLLSGADLGGYTSGNFLRLSNTIAGAEAGFYLRATRTGALQANQVLQIGQISAGNPRNFITIGATNTTTGFYFNASNTSNGNAIGSLLIDYESSSNPRLSGAGGSMYLTGNVFAGNLQTSASNLNDLPFTNNRIDGTSPGWVFRNGRYNAQIETRFYFSGTGNLGINTQTAPGYTLTVGDEATDLASMILFPHTTAPTGALGVSYVNSTTGYMDHNGTAYLRRVLAQNVAPNNLDILQYDSTNGWWEPVASTTLGTDDQTASEVPYGGYPFITGTDVEAALDDVGAQLEANATLNGQQTADIGDLVTLTGVAAGSTNLGTFTGTTIADNRTIKQALQDLETGVESAGGGSITLSGDVTGTGTGTIVTDIAANAVGQNEIATDGVGSAEIAANAVGASELASSGVTAGTYSNPTITVTEDGIISSATGDARFPSTGAFKSYGDILYPGNSDSKENYPPASVMDFNPLVDDLVTAEFEDCSQIYNPIVIKVGDYYHLYYAGNTQKFQTVEGDIETTRKKSDFSRIDRVFLAYKHVNDDPFSPWQKWEDGRTAVLDIDGLDSPGTDVGNVWLRAVYWDGTQYVMAYTGDDARDGSNHTFNPAYATSTDGITWTKQGSITEIQGHNVFWMFYANGNHYIYCSVGSTVELWRSSDLSTWTLVDASILPAGYYQVLHARVHNGIVYLGTRNSSALDRLHLHSVPEASIENDAAYVYEGVTLIGETVYGESNNSSSSSPPTLNFHSWIEYDTEKWLFFYSYYKEELARYPFVPETGIRMQSFTNSKPIPQ